MNSSEAGQASKMYHFLIFDNQKDDFSSNLDSFYFCSNSLVRKLIYHTNVRMFLHSFISSYVFMCSKNKSSFATFCYLLLYFCYLQAYEEGFNIAVKWHFHGTSHGITSEIMSHVLSQFRLINRVYFLCF